LLHKKKREKRGIITLGHLDFGGSAAKRARVAVRPTKGGKKKKKKKLFTRREGGKKKTEFD